MATSESGLHVVERPHEAPDPGAESGQSAPILFLPRPRELQVIYNPAAGRLRRRIFRRTLRRLALAGCRLSVTETSAPGDAERIASRFADRHNDVVVIAGGDGTINEALNGLTSTGGSKPAAIVPLGTANVLAQEIGLAARPEAIVSAIVNDDARLVHMGRVESDDGSRCFTLMIGAGFDALIVANVGRRLKKLGGKFAYFLQALIEFLRYKPHLYEVVVDGKPYRAASVIVANGHFYGGRFVCAPDADIEDDTLYACLFERTGRWNVLRYGIALSLGLLPRLRDYRIIPARHVRIEGPAGNPVQADGDLVTRLPVTVRAAGDWVRLIFPAR